MTDGANSWICPSCRMRVTTPFCGSCGEEPLAPRDLTLRGLAEKVIHALTSVDARAARSGWRLLRYPGQLTRAWIGGIRRTYVAPFQLFLIANVLFFALQSLTNQSIFSSSLDSHLHHQDWSDLAQSLVASRLEATHTSLEHYAPGFDRSVVLNAKSFILLMAILFSLLLPLAFFRERRPFMAHVVFSLHLYTFLLLVFCVALLAAKLSEFAGLGGLVRMERPAPDLQPRGLRCESGRTAAQSRIQMGAGDEERTICRLGCPCGVDCCGGGGSRQ